MVRTLVVTLVFLMSLRTAAPAAAQGGDGALSGSVKDSQGGALPGVTVTATSPVLFSPSVTVTDASGNYRLINLPPGTFKVTADLPGFAARPREGVLLRAGSNFQVDIVMEVGSLSETITVAGETPMLEVSKPGSVLTIDAEFQKEAPVVEGKFWSDFLMLTPGVISRPHNDASGRQNYFGNAVEHRDAVTLMEGLYAGNYNDFNINRTGLSSEAIQDTEVKTGGVDAGSPMGYGLVINMASKSGGNQFRGSAVYGYQPFSWNANNVGSGSPATRQVHQYDFAFGGPIKRDKMWFFGAIRYTDNKSGTGRTPQLLATHEAFFPGQPLDDNTITGYQPWGKVTTRLASNHDLSIVYQADRLLLNVVGAEDYEQVEVLSTGGPMVGAKLTSVWGQTVTTTLYASYNTKGGNALDSYKYEKNGPLVEIHREAFLNQGILQGSGLLLRGGQWSSTACDACYDLDTSTITMLRGDLNWYKQGWGGSHEFRTGFLAMPRSNYEKRVEYLNNGFTLEEQKQKDPNNPAAGTVPFSRQYVLGDLGLLQSSGRDKDIGLYVQDMWKPGSRMTVTVGVRVDFVRRFDALRNLQRQSSTEIGPRAGFSYLLTADAKNVLRGTYGKYHQQLMGTRNPVPSFGGNDAQGLRSTYDLDGNGTFETEFITPPVATTISSLQFDPDLHQPSFDEWTLGFRRQFPGQIAMDVAGIVKVNHDQFAQVDINGFYPDAPFKPFGGFGRVDPNQGLLYRLTNNTWGTTHYRALQATVSKNMSHGFQALFTVQRQWQHLEGTWNPSDPAQFIQPDAFPNSALIWRTDGVQDHNSLATGGSLTNNPMWNPYSVRMAGTWHAPAGLVVSGSYTIVAGTWNGPVIDQLPANSPLLAPFGPSTVTSSTGVRQPNPLATRIRFYFPTRGEGQTRAPDVHAVGIKLGKIVRLGGPRNVELSTEVFNLLNAGNYTEYSRTGPNRIYNPQSYLTYTNPQTPRAATLQVVFRF
jgi:Carboxypeptidase regulatory-like domain